MNVLQKWVKLPTGWINDGGLKDLRWKAGSGGTHIGSLMTMAALMHHAHPVTGITSMTYDAIETATGLSRAKVADSLSLLKDLGLIADLPMRSMYQIANYDPASGWAKMPALPLYAGGRIIAFADFHLRSQAELNALKLYYLFIARRDRDTNTANITFDSIRDLSGVPREKIRTALSLLINNDLIHIDKTPRENAEFGYVSRYRITHIDPFRHDGTTGRGEGIAGEEV